MRGISSLAEELLASQEGLLYVLRFFFGRILRFYKGKKFILRLNNCALLQERAAIRYVVRNTLYLKLTFYFCKCSLITAN